MTSQLNKLLYTLTEPGGVTQVTLLLDGEPMSVFSGEVVVLEQPWACPSGEAWRVKRR